MADVSCFNLALALAIAKTKKRGVAPEEHLRSLKHAIKSLNGDGAGVVMATLDELEGSSQVVQKSSNVSSTSGLFPSLNSLVAALNTSNPEPSVGIAHATLVTLSSAHSSFENLWRDGKLSVKAAEKLVDVVRQSLAVCLTGGGEDEGLEDAVADALRPTAELLCHIVVEFTHKLYLFDEHLDQLLDNDLRPSLVHGLQSFSAAAPNSQAVAEVLWAAAAGEMHKVLVDSTGAEGLEADKTGEAVCYLNSVLHACSDRVSEEEASEDILQLMSLAGAKGRTFEVEEIVLGLCEHAWLVGYQK